MRFMLVAASLGLGLLAFAQQPVRALPLGGLIETPSMVEEAKSVRHHYRSTSRGKRYVRHYYRRR